MEKDLGVPKPGDLFIGVIDLFAVLVPGVIAVALIVWAKGWPLPEGFVPVVGLLAMAWIVGHVLYGFGSWLDILVYDPLFRPRGKHPKSEHGWIWRYVHKNDEVYLLAMQMTGVTVVEKTHSVDRDPPGGMYQWARTWLDSNGPEATAALDRLEADSKLFRSLTVLLIASLAVPLFNSICRTAAGGCIEWPTALTNHWRKFIVFASAGLLFSLWRYCDLRHKAIRRCYLSYIQRRSAGPRRE